MRVVGLIIYLIGVVSIVSSRQDIVKLIMSIELMLVGVTLNMVLTSILIDDVVGEVFGIFILTVAAGESAIGLGILISYFRIRGNVEMEHLNLVQG